VPDRTIRVLAPDGAVRLRSPFAPREPARALRVGASREARGWASSRAVVDPLVGSELRPPLAPTPGIDVGRRTSSCLSERWPPVFCTEHLGAGGYGSSTTNQAVIPARGETRVPEVRLDSPRVDYDLQ
jgi:hypothetical protein